MKKIGILGGTFNPIHDGHIYLAKQAIAKLGLDEVLLIPNRVSPFRTNEEIVDYDTRFTMCELAVKNEKQIFVSDVEKHLPSPSYTIQTIEELKKDNDNAYYLLIGDDQAMKFTEWKDYQRILDLVEVVVFLRNEDTLDLAYSYTPIQCDLHPASATAIRKGNFLYLNNSVKDYILQNDLYIHEIVRTHMSSRRYEHSLSVQKVSIELAKLHNLNVFKASLAALLHDICKEMDAETTASYMELEDEAARNLHPNVHHQFVGARYVEEKLQIQDTDILDAIRYHTTGGLDNPYVYILFIADKIEPSRGYDATQEMELAKIDLKTAYDFVKCKQQAFIKKG